MMKRNSSKDSFIGGGGRNLHIINGIYNSPVAGLLSHRRIMNFTNTTEDFSNHNRNNLDIFSRNRRTLSVASSDESDLQVRLERLSTGSTKPAKGILDDLLSSNEGGKHDYDWLLTPPEAPLLPSSNGKESQPKSVAPKRNPSVRSSSTNRTSRLSDSYHPSGPSRSSSVTRPSISTTQNTNRNSNILTPSSASVSSYIKLSAPTNRSPSATRPRTTPSRSRPSTTTTTSIDRTIRPSTPTPRPQSPTVRPASTSTRKNPTSFNNRSVGPTSRPNSPVSRARAPPQPINLPGFPNETPPKLRTSLPERPVSAGRSRPGATIVTSGRLAEPPGRDRRSHANRHMVESVTRKPVKVLNSENGAGFGRSISKKSLDMGIKHLDIRTGGACPLSGSTRFPQSIRSSQGSSTNNNVNSKNGNLRNGYSVKPEIVEHKSQDSSKLTRVDVHESLRYDTILLKEDLKNTSWLHSADGKSDQGPLFDHGFEPLPEPFAPL